MEYRTLPHGEEKISVIGLGSGSLTGVEQDLTLHMEEMETQKAGGIPNESCRQFLHDEVSKFSAIF